MKTALIFMRRWLALYKMRSIEITLQGAVDTLPNIRCTETRLRMALAIRRMRNELSKARAHYTSLLPVGERRVWDLA